VYYVGSMATEALKSECISREEVWGGGQPPC